MLSAAACGTAAAISPVGKVVDGQKEIVFGAGMEAVGPVMSLSSATR